LDGTLFVDEGESEERRAPRRSSDDDDDKAEEARRITQGILDRMELDARAAIRDDHDEVVINISGEDAGRAIGKKGQTLEALQFLVNKIVNRDPDARRHIILDSGNYRERHDNSLISMAKREAKRAVQHGRVITLEPMSARDRRVVHVSLAQFTGVSTRSEGEGTDRRLQIIPARESSRGRDRGTRGPTSSGGARERGPSRDRGPRTDREPVRRDDADRGPPREREPVRRDDADRGPPREREPVRRDDADRGPPRERESAPRDFDRDPPREASRDLDRSTEIRRRDPE
jgi:spoIIIJ-associated protein